MSHYRKFTFYEQERRKLRMVENHCLSCKEIYNTNNISVEQQDVHDMNFCRDCWEQLKMWNASQLLASMPCRRLIHFRGSHTSVFYINRYGHTKIPETYHFKLISSRLLTELSNSNKTDESKNQSIFLLQNNKCDNMINCWNIYLSLISLIIIK